MDPYFVITMILLVAAFVVIWGPVIKKEWNDKDE